MGRIQLEIPAKFMFSATLEVRASDVNYGGHVGNDKMLGLMQETRILFYRSLGFRSDMHFEANVGHVISDATVIYKSEAFLGDKLKIKIAVADITNYGFDMLYLVTNSANQKETARGKTGMVCFDFEKRKVAPIPGVLLGKLKGLIKGN